MTLANMTQEETDKRNRNHCRAIADELEVIALGQAYKCPHCSEIINIEKHADDEAFYDAVTEGDEAECPHCASVGEFEQTSVCEWLEGALDIRYTVNADMSYCAGRVTVTIGGPNIYVDTLHNAVMLYWWSDRAEYPLAGTARDALDEALQELYECGR